MYHLAVTPREVHQTLAKYILADGYDITFDMERSHGVTIYDSKHDRELLDFFTCFASVPLGYNHPKMTGDPAFTQSLLRAALTNPSNSDVYTVEYAQFVETFARVAMPAYLPHAFFVSGGALAVENALKAAMDWKVQKNFQKGYNDEKGTKVLHFERAFHGRSGYTLSLTNTQPNKTKWFARFDWPRVSSPMQVFPLTSANVDDTIKREQQAIEQLKQAFADNNDDICAIIIEPIQAEGGDNHFRVEFMEQLRILADENEALLIYDEVQTGVGLTGKFWCHEHFGERARPDIVAFGKKMQVCGILAGQRLNEIETNVFRVPSRINSTWGGSLVDMVRATKILEIIEEDGLLAHVEAMGGHLQQGLHAIADTHHTLSNVRGKGLFCAFDFPDQQLRDAFLKKSMERGAFFLGCGNRSVRFRPALIIQPSAIEAGMAIAHHVMDNLS
ncbi:L-lysine 6-transaminase [Parapedobacter pyrenivorans]|uniref:L-lysine-epsilon aminotransferase n=1 Tax=Parapedobacter pyrenivorans TaxID=1305674 RepID=A0A917HU68_9SPHI|nr:L-lysine 6-transaminase [Parapedobacter pyrenivorans]GGG90761.1 L-lysine 6-transaminase [Parapedobacter pyrenivorans]